MAIDRSVMDLVRKAANNFSEALEELGQALDEETIEILRQESDHPVVVRMSEFLGAQKSLQYSGLESLARNFRNEVNAMCRKQTIGEGEE